MLVEKWIAGTLFFIIFDTAIVFTYYLLWIKKIHYPGSEYSHAVGTPVR